MNKEEIKHFKSLLRQGSLRHMNILLDDKFQKELQIIIKDYEKLQKENQELKKQLEEYLIQNINLRADIMIQKMASPNELIKDKTFYNLYDMPTYEELLVQQKEFIKWLEDYLNLFDYMDIQEQAGYDMLEEILQKYREIIGVSDEKK